MHYDPLSILLVDDDDVAIESVVRGLTKYKLDAPTIVAEDGAIALSILRGTHESRAIRQPYVILLDLNMPRMDGFEFLQELRSDLNLKPAVVFVLSTSGSERDRERAYDQNIAGYIVKPAAGAQYSFLATLLNDYQALITLPKGDREWVREGF